MKKTTSALVGIAAMCLTAVAFASGDEGGGHGMGNGNGNSASQSQTDPTIQATMLVNTAVMNTAFGANGFAQQNLASNVGSFSSNATIMQMAAIKDSLLINAGMGGQANQNIASNVGEDGLHTSTYQVAMIRNSAVINRASWGGKALQNLSSNSNCLTCQ
jgi:hypothetical protein